ncbi:Polycystic kidney disease 1-related protein [Holothuria leucospilota]|uniref:Polycystic kidney disease 1-related protein n=1 Tax=Holothuria leucospilota TaxID=206669 RepID=A0A9Q1CJQ6_HOLLE|nr:Polycystic kidney disease 1-related protein [Holothuria leucospilota]
MLRLYITAILLFTSLYPRTANSQEILDGWLWWLGEDETYSYYGSESYWYNWYSWFSFWDYYSSESYWWDFGDWGYSDFFTDLEFEIFPSEGEIVTGFTFTDGMNLVGKALNKPNVRKSMAVFCTDLDWLLTEVLSEDVYDEVCGAITIAAETDGRVDGLSDLCEEFDYNEHDWYSYYWDYSYPQYSSSWNWFNYYQDWFNEDHFSKRSVDKITHERKKRDSPNNYDYYDYDFVPQEGYFTWLLKESVGEELGIVNFTNNVVCDEIGQRIESSSKPMNQTFYDMLYFATGLMVEIGFRHCPQNDSDAWSYYSSYSSDYWWYGSDYSWSGSYYSWWADWFYDDEFLSHDSDIIGIMVATARGDKSTNDTCDALFAANKTNTLDDFRKSLVNSTITLLTDYDVCVKNFNLTKQGRPEFFERFFNSSNVVDICSALVRSFVDPAEDTKLELDFFWFYDDYGYYTGSESWWDYSWSYPWSSSWSYSESESESWSSSWSYSESESESWSYSESESESWSFPWSYSESESESWSSPWSYSESESESWGDYSFSYSWVYSDDFWYGAELNWGFAFEFLSPHITPESWLSLAGKLYNAKNVSDAFLDFCSALPDDLYVFEMEEMCDALRDRNISHWINSCYYIGSEASGPGIDYWYDDWLDWNDGGWFDWEDEWYDWYYWWDDWSYWSYSDWSDWSYYDWSDWSYWSYNDWSDWSYDDWSYWSYDDWSYWSYWDSEYDDWNEEDVFMEGLWREALQALGMSLHDPYETCFAAEQLLTANNREIEKMIDHVLGNVSNYVSYWAFGIQNCYQFAPGNSYSFSYSPWNYDYSYDYSQYWWEEQEIFLYGIINAVTMGLGRYDGREDMCIDLYSKIWEGNGPGETFTTNIRRMFTSKSKCVDFFETVSELQDWFTVDVVSDDFRNFDKLCTYVVNTMEDGDIELEVPEFTDDEFNFPFSFIVGMLSKLMNSNNVLDVAIEVCDDYSEVLEEFLSEDEVEDLCKYVRNDDEYHFVRACEDMLVSTFHDDEEIYLSPFPVEDIGQSLLEVFDVDIEELSHETPCIVLDAAVNGDLGILDIVTETIDTGLKVTIPWLSNLCEEMDEIEEWINGGSYYDSYEDGFDIITLEEIDLMVGIVTGQGSIEGACDAIIRASDRSESAVEALAVDLREAVMSIITNPGRCRLLVGTLNDKVKSLLPESVDENESEFLLEFTWITGYTTVDDFCEDLVQAMTQEEVEECRGIEDCAGVCNGDAKPDCAGVCNGGADYDCAGECNGAAFINNCTECVGGRTGRPWYFGADRCGNCKAFSGYLEVWDCYGTCYGTAYRDKCGACVGGLTGRSEDYSAARLDCRNICDGGWVEDTCNFCEPATDEVYVGGSKYKDCSDTCVTPGFQRAFENDCDVCVGGSTGLEEDSGYNVCGQCESDPEADETSCNGCDNVPNSGKELDACGVCGGDGTDCVGVGLLVPDYIPDRSVTVTVYGAGFSESSDLTCIFYDADSGSQTEGEVVDWINNVVITCQADLDAGEYEVGVRRDSDQPNNIRGSLKVYEDVSISSLSPLEVDIDPTKDQQLFNMTVTASGSPFTAMAGETDYTVVPSIIAEDADGYITILSGIFTSSSEMLVPVSMPRRSGEFTLTPSVNSVHGLGTSSFTGTVYYPAPQLESAKFADNGAALVVFFDLFVEYRVLSECSDIFDDVGGLGTGAECYWIGTKVLVVLFGKYDGTTLLVPGDSLTLKDDAVKSFNEDNSRSGSGSVTIDSADNPPRVTALLSGPETIPSCGYVSMDGRKSTGSGARALTYVWSVTSSGSTSAVDSTLASINAENSGSGAAEVEFDGTDMDADTDYEFTLTVTNFLGESDSTSLTVTRSGVAAPEVKVLVEGTDADSTLIADSFSLTAEVKYYSECVPAGETQFQWSTNNSDVPLNLKTMYTRRLYIPANSLPGGENIEFTVRVFKSSDESAYVESSITITTIKSALIAVIDGGKEFTVGRDSGDILLSAANSIDPDEEAREWEYEWQCIQTTDNSACWSFNPATIGFLIVNGTNVGDAQLEFDALSLEADKSYEFTVTVRKDDRSDSASVVISAVNGNPPKIYLSSSDDDNTVNDDEYIVFTAVISHESDVQDVTWETADTDLGYGYIDFTDVNNLLVPPGMYSTAPGSTFAIIGVQKGIVSRGTEYVIALNVTTVDGQSSASKLYLTVRSGPTSCDFTVADYEELAEVTFLTENCVTSSDAYPLNFQLFVEKDDGSYEAVTEKKSEPSISGIGKPKLDGSDTRTYIMKVCDKNLMCSEYDVTATVTEKSSFSEQEISDFKANNVEAKKYAGDTISAIANRNMLPDATTAAESRKRRRRSAEATSELATEQLELVQLTLENSVLDSSSAQTLLDQIEFMNTNDMTLADQSTFLGYLADIVDVYLNEGTAISESSANIIFGKCSDIGSNLDPLYNENILDEIETVQTKLSKSLSSDLSVGAPAVEVQTSEYVSTVQKAVLSGVFSSKSSGDVISIDFGSELSALYGASWSCGSDTCSGVSLSMVHYDTGSDYFSTDSNDITYRLCDIISIEISNPNTGQKLNVSDLSSTISMAFPVTRTLSSEVTPSCVYWDDELGTWSTDGLDTTDGGSSITCESDHLTAFTVIGVPVPTTEGPANDLTPEVSDNLDDLVESIAGIIVIIVVAVLASFIILLIIIVVLVIAILKMSGRKNTPAQPAQPVLAQPAPTTTIQMQALPQTQVAPVAQPGYYPPQTMTFNPTYGYNAAMPSPPPYGTPHDPYGGAVSTSRPPPPSVTLVAPSGELVMQKLYESKDGKEGKDGKENSYSDYMSAVTSGLPGVEATTNAPGLNTSINSSHTSLTQHF